ncbi:MAG: flagellar motor protein MotB [Rhodospirillaceae bacterium]
MIRPGRYSDGQAATMWMVTFADLVLLLLAFFVMLFSMTGFDQADFAGVIETPSMRRDAPLDGENNPVRVTSNLASVPRQEAGSLFWVAGVVRRALAEDPLLSGHAIDVDARPGRLILTIPPEVLLSEATGQDARDGSAPTDAEIGPGRPLVALAMVLNRLDNRIAVVGHAAPQEGYEESLSRAMAAAEVLRRAGYGRDAEVRGHGDTLRRDAAIEIQILEEGLRSDAGGAP